MYSASYIWASLISTVFLFLIITAIPPDACCYPPGYRPLRGSFFAPLRVVEITQPIRLCEEQTRTAERLIMDIGVCIVTPG
jgi:hypothetical protein